MQGLVEMVRFHYLLIVEKKQHNWSADHLYSPARVFNSISCQSIL